MNPLTGGGAGPREIIPPSPRAAGAPPPPPPPHEPLLSNAQPTSNQPPLNRNGPQTLTTLLAGQTHGGPAPPGQPNFNLVPVQQSGRPAPAAVPIPAPAATTWLTTAAGAGMNPAAADSSAFPQLGGGMYNQAAQAAGVAESTTAGPSVKGFIQKLQAGGAGAGAPTLTVAQQTQLQAQQRDAATLRQRHEAEEEALRQRAAAQQPPVLQQLPAQTQLLHAQSGLMKPGGPQPAAAGGALLGQRLASGPLYALAATGRESFDSVSSASQLPASAAAAQGTAQDKKQQADQQQQGQAPTQQQQAPNMAADAQKKGSQSEVDRELVMRAAALVGSPELVLPTMTAVYPHHTAQQVLDSCYA